MRKEQMTKQVYSAPGIRTVALRSAKMIAKSGDVGGNNSNIDNDDSSTESNDNFF